MKKTSSYAFIDGQNLYLETKKDNWSIDYQKLKIYLKDKYHVQKIFYFWGYYKKENEHIYKKMHAIGYIQIFKEHSVNQTSIKKGNIDSNLVFEIMKKVCSKEKFNKIILISGDGDYKKIVYYLVQRNMFEKILFPSFKSASSLYKKLGSEYFDYLSIKYIREKIGRKNKKRAP
jgi:uncharacterized LabA/DUF88 family protein